MAGSRSRVRIPWLKAAISIGVVSLASSLLAACGTTSSGQATTSGPVTLTLTDCEAGTNLVTYLQDLATSYHKLHPNVTIKIKSISFTAMLDTGQLILSGSDVPSLFEVSQTYGSIYQLAKHNLIGSLAPYAKQYGWYSEFSPAELKLGGEVSVSSNPLWSGGLYGVPYLGNVVGVFYNKKLLAKVGGSVPTTLAAFEHDLQLAKGAGLIPLTAGGGANTYQLAQDVAEIAGSIAPTKAAETYLFNLAGGKPGPTWTSPYVVQAVQLLKTWSADKYLSPDVLSLTESAADSEFTSGKSLFIINGNWQAPAFQQPMGSNVGFFMLPSATTTHGAEPVIGTGNALAIPANGANHAAAVAFLNYAVGKQGAEALIKDAGQLPLLTVPGEVSQFKGAEAQIAAAWLQTGQQGAGQPFWGSNTADSLTQLSSALDEVLGGRMSPAQLGSTMQSDEVNYRKTLQ
jgi:raffinose/stachyose/melibiose transport system substrate-binding protein